MKFHKLNKIIFGILAVMLIIGVAAIWAQYPKIKQQQNVTPSESQIVVTAPKLNESVSTPLKFTGKADGSWYFEGVFPVSLLDEDGTVLGMGQAVAQSDWTKGGLIEFVGEIKFSLPKGKSGTLLFENDNPSGLVEKHKEFKLPVKFANLAT